jgi:adenylate cyclase
VAIEIERKFLLSNVSVVERLGPGVHIRQGYLAEEDGVEVRVRITPDHASITVKAGTGLARTEVDVPVAGEDAEALWAHTIGRRIDKTRYPVVLDEEPELLAEVDVYGGDLDGLCVVEVEFGSETGAASFVPPAWFGREVTGERGWNNAALARHGRPATT